MPTIEVKSTATQLAALQAELAGIPQGAERVMTRSINKVAVSARTEIVRRVAGEITLTQTELRRRNVELRRANFRVLVARILITGARVPLARFGATRTPRGLRYRIRRGEGLKLDPAGFTAVMPSGHTGAFHRRPGQWTRTTRRKRWQGRWGQDPATAGRAPRLPLDELYGPSVPALVEDLPEFAEAAYERHLGDQLDEEIHTQVGLVLARHGGAAADG
ncbi:MAG: hypothetical protein GX591_02435 [Planctomycetes bacterium]|nr:hypothetical protein [Planctomycetota bacterium]